MPSIRIYAFAKELGLDNKQLLDICDEAGVKGKGSALASLDEDEVTRLRAFMDSGGGTATATAPVEEEPVLRPPSRTLDTRVPEIRTPRSVVAETPVEDQVSPESEPVTEEVVAEKTPVEQASKQAQDPVAAQSLPTVEAPPAVESPAVESPPVEEPVAEVAPAEQEPVAVPPAEPVAKQAPAEPAPEPKPEVAEEEVEKPTSKVGGLLDRLRGATKKTAAKKTEENIQSNQQQQAAPARRSSPPPLAPRSKGRKELRNLDNRPQRSGEEAPRKGAPKRRTANFNIAAMPDVKQPTAPVDTGEKVQKPDIALPEGARKTIQAGGTAPLEDFTKSKRKDKKKGRGGREEAGTGTEADRNARNKGRLASRFGNSPMGRRNVGGRRTRSNYHRPGSRKKSGRNTAAPRKDSAVLQLPCSVREFSEVSGVPAIKTLLTLKQLGDDSNPNINSMMNDELVEILVEEFGIDLEIRQAVSLEDEVLGSLIVEDAEEDLQPRPPIVTFLGHVDHGKTSLLDALIGINVVSGEAGGITQHIRAYQIEKDGNRIAFVDTPGHEAFTEMRARGANVTDIAVLVVAADDGVMPQTAEAITHAKAAGVPIVVALNKIDLPGITADKAMQDLAAAELLPSEWGGETEVVRTSAISGDGLDNLLETILVTAELYEFQANPDRAAYGTCLESEQQSDRGVVCKVLVQGGTLNVGDVVVCGSSYGRVKAMHDTLQPRLKLDSVGPSTPVNLTGFNTAPGAGDKLYVVDDIAKAREIAQAREEAQHEVSVAGTVKVGLDDFQRRLEEGRLATNEGDLVTLNLILRADTKGSIEAIKKELGKIDHPEVRIKIIQALVGGVTVADVRLAQASEAVICAFNVVPDENAKSLSDEVGAEIRRYEVIYKITDDLKATLEGRLKPEEQVVELGMAMVLRTFAINKHTIAGCRVMRGNIHRDARMRLIRDSTIIGDYAIDSLKREKDDAKEVQRGMECGIKLSSYNDIKEGDTLEAYRIEEVARTL